MSNTDLRLSDQGSSIFDLRSLFSAIQIDYVLSCGVWAGYWKHWRSQAVWFTYVVHTFVHTYICR